MQPEEVYSNERKKLLEDELRPSEQVTLEPYAYAWPCLCCWYKQKAAYYYYYYYISKSSLFTLVCDYCEKFHIRLDFIRV